jgi:anti-anti-sigma factor
MEPCEYIDSTFLGILINMLKHIEKSGGDLKLASIGDEIKFILDISRTSESFKIYPDTETALRSFIHDR